MAKSKKSVYSAAICMHFTVQSVTFAAKTLSKFERSLLYRLYKKEKKAYVPVPVARL
jgi:hypothetical protein